MQEGTITARFQLERIEKSDEKQQVFGWAYVTNSNTGEPMIDHSGDMVEIGEIEQAAYKFAKFWREGSDNHERGGVATLIESMVFTPEKATALGIPLGALPSGWWVGFEVTDDTVWEKIKSGEYRMLSIEGTARRVPIS